MLNTSRSSHQKIDPSIRPGKREPLLSQFQRQQIDELISVLQRMKQTTTRPAYILRRQRMLELLRNI